MAPTSLSPLRLASELAPTYPQLAYWLAQPRLRSNLLGFHTLEYSFESGAVGQPAEVTFPTTLGEDFYVLDLRSTVQRPNYAAGNIFKAQSDLANAQQSGIWAKLQVVGGAPGSRYLINDTYLPLEIIAPNANSQSQSPICGMNAVLTYSQSVRADLVLRRAYAGGELPAHVAISFVGYSLGCRNYDSISVDEATSYLRGLPGLLGNR